MPRKPLNETEEERQARLDRQNATQRARRARQSEQLQQQIRERNRIAQQSRRAADSDEMRQERRIKNNAARKARRTEERLKIPKNPSIETEEERQLRLDKQNAAQRARRARQSMQRLQQIREKDRIAQQFRRAAHSEEMRQERRNKNKVAQMARRMEERLKTRRKASNETQKDHQASTNITMNVSTCVICTGNINISDPSSCRVSPCCGKTWVHPQCIQKSLYGDNLPFKCSTCAIKLEFDSNNGILERDEECIGKASIKIEVACSADDCLCDEGRYVSHVSTLWEVVICSACHSQGTHRRCSNLQLMTNDWQCVECRNQTHLDTAGWVADHLLVKIEEVVDIKTEGSVDWSSEAMKVETPACIKKTIKIYRTTRISGGSWYFFKGVARCVVQHLTRAAPDQNTTRKKTHKPQPFDVGENPFKCIYDDCTKSFNRSFDLKVHQRIHTSEKPYKCNCDKCSKSFNYSSNLKRHQHIHTGEKLYKWDSDKCTTSFYSLSKLKEHQRIHTDDKPYKCNWL